MHHTVEAAAGEDRVEQHAVAQIGLEERFRRNRVTVTAREVVDDDGLVAFLEQHPRHVRADVAGSADDENPHAARSPEAVCAFPVPASAPSLLEAVAATAAALRVSGVRPELSSSRTMSSDRKSGV